MHSISYRLKNLKLQKEFPVLGKGLTYLDSAAKSLTPSRVVNAMNTYYSEMDVNVERGVYQLSRAATVHLTSARESIAALVGADSDEIVIARNTTEAIGMVCYGLRWKPDDVIITSLVEHHSNYLPWLRLRKRLGVEVIALHPRNDGLITPEIFKKAISGKKVRLMAVTSISNSLGTVQPVEELCSIARSEGALSLVDAAQAIPHRKTDVRKLGCDFLVWSGHKMFGPTGTGALFGRKDLLCSLDPLHAGGGTIRDVGSDYFNFDYDPPSTALEGGTTNIAGIIGFGEASMFLSELQEDSDFYLKETELDNLAVKELRSIPGVRIFGPLDTTIRSGIISFIIENCSPHRVAAILDEDYGIMVRSGHHCALPLMKNVLQCPQGTVRASFHYYSTVEDVERLVKAVGEIARNSP